MSPAAMHLAVSEIAVVSGASGFVATTLVRQLLESGYTVRGTVRSLADPHRTEFLTKLGDALPGTLELHEADLLKDGSFDKVIEGADVVFHTASPFIRGQPEDPDKELLQPAVQGTTNVLNSVAKAKSVRRVVLTSSCASVIKPKSGPLKGDKYTDQDWNTDATLDTSAYMYSKKMAEEKAWELAKQHNIDLVVICPVFVMGPLVSKRTGGVSVDSMVSILEGKLNQFSFPYLCDVRDIAQAHIRAAELPEAKGRYIVSQGPITSQELIGTMSKLYPKIKFAEAEQQDFSASSDSPMRWAPSNERSIKELGITPIPVWVMLKDMAGSVLSLGIASPTMK